MTNMQLLEAIGMLDEETILDAEQVSVKKAVVLSAPRKRLMRQITALAACACLLFGGAVLAHVGGWGQATDGATSPGAEPSLTAAGNGEMTTAGVTTPSQDAAGDKAEAPATSTTTMGLSSELAAASTKAPTAEATTTAVYTTTTAVTYTTTTRPVTTTTRATTTAAATTTRENTSAMPGISVPAEGLLVYSEDFNGYSDTALSLDTLNALGWTKLTVADDKAYSESDVAFALRDGRLYFDNYDTAGDSFGDGTLTRGKDAYYAIGQLNDDYMKPIVAGRYTLEYDLEYTGAASVSRYAALITELSSDGQCYNSFHLRIGGLANHQCHFYGSWKNFSTYDPATDLNPAADDPTGAKGTPLVKKLLGLDLGDVADKQNLAGVRVTIRLQWDPECGHHVYMKTADMTEFIKVSEPTFRDDGIMYIGWEGWAVGLKIGGAVEGYIDNIRIWTGWGDAPSDQRYQPSK